MAGVVVGAAVVVVLASRVVVAAVEAAAVVAGAGGGGAVLHRNRFDACSPVVVVVVVVVVVAVVAVVDVCVVVLSFAHQRGSAGVYVKLKVISLLAPTLITCSQPSVQSWIVLGTPATIIAPPNVVSFAGGARFMECPL